MPNDMSPIDPANTTTRLAQQTRRYCDRAHTLAHEPCLTMTDAAHALDHLARLQQDLAQMRLRDTSGLQAEINRVEAPIKSLEDALIRARAEVSEALLHAIRNDSPTDTNLYGPVAHGMQPDDAINHTKDTKPTPPKAISASRALLDLEALRPYLSDAALREAIERHRKDTGRHDIAGVAYARLPTSALLACLLY